MVQKKTGQVGPRFFIYFIGLLIMSLGIVLLLRADLGVPPWDVLHVGLFLHFGWTIGSWNIIVGIIILSLSSLLIKELPQIGAFLNMIFIGIFIDLYMLLPFLKTPSFLAGKIFMLLMGIMIIGYGMGFYISASFGAGPRDSLMIALTTVTGKGIVFIRASIEVIVLLIGWFLGGPVFIGTILFTVIIGPVSGWVIPQCERFTNKILTKLANRKQRKLPFKIKNEMDRSENG